MAIITNYIVVTVMVMVLLTIYHCNGHSCTYYNITVMVMVVLTIISL